MHGFSRNGRDFDSLARQLSLTCRVICPDMPGRGRSAWLAQPSQERGYNVSQYLLDVTALLARLDVTQVDWVGTSMGALVGMMLAAQPDTPVSRLVMNDAGAVVPGAFLEYLSTYVGKDPDFETLNDLEAYLRKTYSGFGDLTDAQWRHLARHAERRKSNGKIGLAYDPAIALSLAPPFNDQVLWQVWDNVRCPVLLLRGEKSPALPKNVAKEMTQRGPRATLVEIPGCGHAPALMSPTQMTLIETWLATGQVH
jgi:pimeloyl-ACP methyl ester carboxylesterase